jgi:hypothetical protein
VRRRVILGAAMLLLASCELLSSSNGPPGNPTSPCSGAPLQSVAGGWDLRGTGTRRGCTKPQYEGSFQLRSAPGFRVMESQADAGTEEVSLVLEGAPTGFTFRGSAGGICLEFETRESVDEGMLEFFFEGDLSGRSTVHGSFTGMGPASCVSEGTFELTLQ